MQVFIAFVLLFSLRTISFAADVTIYNRNPNYSTEPFTEPSPIAESQNPWKFSFITSDVTPAMIISWKNIPPSVTTINVTCVPENGISTSKVSTDFHGQNVEFYLLYFVRKMTAIECSLNLYSSNILCASLLVAKGWEVTKIPNKVKAQDCQMISGDYVLLVDLINQCDENAEQHQKLLLFLIPSLIGVCAIILLVICLLRGKKCTPLVEAVEFNTVSHQPFYLNMLFRRECDKEIEEIDQHQYEEIVPQISTGG